MHLDLTVLQCPKRILTLALFNVSCQSSKGFSRSNACQWQFELSGINYCGLVLRVGIRGLLGWLPVLRKLWGRPSCWSWFAALKAFILVILRLLLIWPFWVCMTTDIGDLYYLITAPLFSDRNQNACDNNQYILGVTRCGGISCRVRSSIYLWIHEHSASLQRRVCHDS